MDRLIESALNAAALRPDAEPTCANHPGHYAPREHDGKRLCWTCWKALNIPEKRPYLRSLDPTTPAWERAALTGAPEKDALYAHQEKTLDGCVGQITWRHPK